MGALKATGLGLLVIVGLVAAAPVFITLGAWPGIATVLALSSYSEGNELVGNIFLGWAALSVLFMVIAAIAERLWP